MKIVYITPRLSTGGLPQYLYKKIETFINNYEIFCIEWKDKTGGQFNVQRNKISSLLTDRLYSVEEDGNQLLSLISQINPDIIHFEEIPETFIYDQILSQIYSKNRDYKIVVTTHWSKTNPGTLKYSADKFILVNNWSKNKFEEAFPIIPSDVWEYPIEYQVYNKEDYKKKLGFEEGYKHILNVELFTPGKNQEELIDLAKRFYKDNIKVKFHFVGNMANNFKIYWEEIINDIPENCILHGEKSNVEDYYKASDIFYFTSNFELNPIVIKEAFSFNLPVFMKKLPSYLDTYDGYVTYIGNNKDENYENLTKAIDENIHTRQIDFRKNSDLIYENISSLKNLSSITEQVPIVSLINGPSIELRNFPPDNYSIQMFSNGILLHQSITKNDTKVSCDISYFKDWKIVANAQSSNIRYEYNTVLGGHKVYIAICSKALGDSLAWFPYVEEFRKKWNCKVIVSTYLNELFIDQYPELEFVEPGEFIHDVSAVYRIGWFYDENELPDLKKVPHDFRKHPMQKTASDILGLKYTEIKPLLKIPKVEKQNKVGIAIHATCQAKYWNNETGWQEVVDYLNNEGYKVVHYSKESDGHQGNFQPIGVSNFIGYTIQDVIDDLSACDFFIGIGSGLSWLAWSLNIPVVLISGFSEEWTEMISGVYRVINKSVCHGCFNRNKIVNNDFYWCPEHQNTDRHFECSKSITGSMVIEQIKKLQKEKIQS